MASQVATSRCPPWSGAAKHPSPSGPGINTVRVYVRAPGGKSDFYDIVLEVGLEFPCTESGIRDAAAKGGGVHTFACDGPTTIVTQDEIRIDRDVILEGRGEVTIDGNDDHRVLVVLSDAVVGIRGFVLTRGAGRSGGGGYNGGTLTFLRTWITGNSCTSTGGGFYNGADLRLIDSVVSDNTSGTHGGGIYQLPDRRLTVVRGSFTNNLAGEGGGAIHNWSGTTTIEDTVFHSNQAQYGGGIYQTGGGGTMLTRVDLSENVSTWRGGALYIQEGDLRVTDTSIERNSAATRGGGIYFAASDPGDVVELRNTRVQDNTSDLEGGGVYCNGGWMRFFDSVIANNTTTGDGGGIFSRLCRPVALQNTTVSGNTAGGLGGGIFNSREMELVHSTVAANASGQNDVASALFLAGGTKLRLHNSLVVGTCVRCAVPDPDTITLCGSPPETTATGINVEPRRHVLPPSVPRGTATGPHQCDPGGAEARTTCGQRWADLDARAPGGKCGDRRDPRRRLCRCRRRTAHQGPAGRRATAGASTLVRRRLVRARVPWPVGPHSFTGPWVAGFSAMGRGDIPFLRVDSGCCRRRCRRASGCD